MGNSLKQHMVRATIPNPCGVNGGVYYGSCWEKIVLKPYTLESCHEFYMSYEADPAMTYDKYAYDKGNVDMYYQIKVLDSTRGFFAIFHGDKVIGENQIKCIDFERSCGTLSIILAND